VKGAAGTDLAALQARQEYLGALAANRCAQQAPPPARASAKKQKVHSQASKASSNTDRLSGSAVTFALPSSVYNPFPR
jgi:hypothetical protein